MDLSSTYPLHECVFKNDVRRLCTLLLADNVNINQKDMHGNTPLHLAVMLGHKGCVPFLLEYGSRIKINNCQHWNPLDEALSYGDRETIQLLLTKSNEQMLDSMKLGWAKITAILQQMGDFHMDFKWDIHSWIPVVSSFLPSDVCQLYKKGSSLRYSFSRNTLVNSALEIKSSITEKDVDDVMSNVIMSMQVDTKSVEFSRAQNGLLFKKDRTETIAGFVAKVYDADGFIFQVQERNEHLSKEQLEKLEPSEIKDDDGVVATEMRQCLSPPSSPNISWKEYCTAPSKSPPLLARAPSCQGYSNRFKAIVAMSEDVQLKLQSLISVLEVVLPNQYMDDLKTFSQLDLPPGFPVKIDMKIFPTVTVNVTMTKLDWNYNTNASSFQIPDNFKDGNDKK